MSRLLSGKRGGTEVDVSAFLAVAEVTGETSSLFLGKPEEIAAYRRILGLLAQTALSEREQRS